MIVGVPKEIKEAENRVGLTPAGAQHLVARGHQVLVQAGVGAGAGPDDDAYTKAGAQVHRDPAEIFAQAELILKVKEPLPPEIPLLRPSQTVFTYFHLAPAPELTKALLGRRIVAVAYETVETADGRHPLLEPMSEVAGKMAVHVGAHYLAKPLGGRGVLLGGVPGVPPATVVILGGGTVGYNTARVAAGTWVAERTDKDTTLALGAVTVPPGSARAPPDASRGARRPARDRWHPPPGPRCR